jgi:hypothetical protein
MSEPMREVEVTCPSCTAMFTTEVFDERARIFEECTKELEKMEEEYLPALKFSMSDTKIAFHTGRIDGIRGAAARIRALAREKP